MSANWPVLLRELVESRKIPETAPGIARDVIVQSLPGKATVLIGVRRAGKSTLMARLMGSLREQGVPRDDILHLDFFDERLAGFGRGQFQEIVEAFLADRNGSQGVVHAFFDEIQETDGWEGFVHRVQQQSGWRIYLTGSSARMLSKEVATSMRGRALTYELFPYSFPEYLRARNLPAEPDSDEARALIRRGCESYLEEGGFPEVLGQSEQVRTRLHQEYFHSILQRDLILRNDAAYPMAVRELTLKLMHDNGTLQSVNRLTGILKAAGHPAPKPFVADCLQWMHDAFLFFPVPIHSNSATKRKANPCKWYCVDPGMVRSVVSKFTADRGRLLENLVFLSLRRRGYAPAYHRTKSGKEIDFVWKGDDGRLHLIQVCWEMETGSTQERELGALTEAIAELKPARARIITWEAMKEFTGIDGKAKIRIETLPAWRFLLEEKTPI